MCFHIHTPSSKKCVKGSCTGLHSLQLRKVHPVPSMYEASSSSALFRALIPSHPTCTLGSLWFGFVFLLVVLNIFSCAYPSSVNFLFKSFVFLLFWFLRLNLTVRLWLALNLLYRRSQPHTCGDFSASAFRVLQFQAWIIILGSLPILIWVVSPLLSVVRVSFVLLLCVWCHV